MFVFEDTTSLQKIYARYRRAISPVFTGLLIDSRTYFRRYSDVEAAVDEVTCYLCWRFLEYYPEAYVLVPAGHLLRLDDNAWIPPYETYQPLNGVINLKSGLLRSSDEHSSYDTPATSAELLAPFEGCPVFLADDEDLLFEDGGFWQDSSSPFMPGHSSFLKDELDQWFQCRAEQQGVLRPPVDDDDDFLRKVFSGPHLHSKMANTGRATRTSNETILQYVMEAFPNGKDSATWAEVEVKVGYSRRSIVRALKSLEQYVDWAGNGHSTQ